METVPGGGHCVPGWGLETFLSGMETSGELPERRRDRDALKPSLVEWKLYNGLEYETENLP